MRATVPSPMPTRSRPPAVARARDGVRARGRGEAAAMTFTCRWWPLQLVRAMATSGGADGHFGSTGRLVAGDRRRQRAPRISGRLIGSARDAGAGRSAPRGGTQVPLPARPAARILGPLPGPSAQDRRIILVRLALIPGQRTRALTALVSCALLLSLALAMPVAAAGPLKLTAGSADPDAGTAGDAFTFAATYVSKDDDPPAFVRVVARRHGAWHDAQQRIRQRHARRRSVPRPHQDQGGGHAQLLLRRAGLEGPRDEPRRRHDQGRAEAQAQAAADLQAGPQAGDDERIEPARDRRRGRRQSRPRARGRIRRLRSSRAFLDYDGGPGSDGFGSAARPWCGGSARRSCRRGRATPSHRSTRCRAALDSAARRRGQASPVSAPSRR